LAKKNEKNEKMGNKRTFCLERLIDGDDVAAKV
jgi:hypothetical protein